MTVSVDPFTLEVIRHALSAIAEEMSLVVMRSARSPLLREAGDLSSALTDVSGELIAQGRDIPMHMGVMSFTVKEFLKKVPAERLAAGDVWFLNLPETGGNHLPDVKAIRPLFAEGALLAFAVSLAHWADIGGALAGSYVPTAIDAWQEGLRRFDCSRPMDRIAKSSIWSLPTCAARVNGRAIFWRRWRPRALRSSAFGNCRHATVPGW